MTATVDVSLMVLRRFLLLLLLGVFATSFQALGETDKEGVKVWLEKMVNAVHTLSYEGTFVYLHDNHLESMRIVHSANSKGESERLVSLNGVAREVVRDNASVTCIAPDSRSVSIGSRVLGQGFRAVLSVDAGQLDEHYSFFNLGEARVADRAVAVVAIVPKDHYRYGYRIYLDKQHGLPLKTDMLNANGDAISQIMFTQLQVDTNVEALTEPSIAGKEDYQWVQQKPLRQMPGGGDKGWQFNDLPAGFAVTLHARKSAGKSEVGMDHFVISDGLASLSLYVEKAGTDAGLHGSSNMGAINAFGNRFQEFQVTVIGEVPALTVEQVAKALHRIQ
ncbi:MAG: MucB/RseB C-terminal domain-containing protein [Sedimenticola sp.]